LRSNLPALTNKIIKQRLRAYEVNYDVHTNVVGTEEATNMQGQQSLKKSSFKQENIWLKTTTSKTLNNSFEEIEDFIILNRFKKKTSFQNNGETT
jgi:hypothetical protein